MTSASFDIQNVVMKRKCVDSSNCIKTSPTQLQQDIQMYLEQHAPRNESCTSGLVTGSQSVESYIKTAAVKLHNTGRFVVAPTGAGKTYYIEHKGINWTDQDPYLEEMGVDTHKVSCCPQFCVYELCDRHTSLRYKYKLKSRH